MPKLVDHDARRTEIAQATWAAVSDLGIERLRLRDIAEEVGFTTGVFAHYFRDKDSVVRFAFNLAYQHTHDRILQSNEAASSDLERLRNALVALIPDKKLPESVAFVSMCFSIRSSNDPLLASAYKKKRNEYRRLLKSYIHDATHAGEFLIDKSPDSVLDLVLAVLDGVCVAALLNPAGYSKARGARVVETMIERLSGDARPSSAELSASSPQETARGATK